MQTDTNYSLVRRLRLSGACVALALAACAVDEVGSTTGAGAGGAAAHVGVVSQALACESNWDCDTFLCTNGQCVECNNDGDCAWRFDGSTCRDHRCAAPSPRAGLYDTCDPGGDDLQGSCESGMVCQTIIREGFRCFEAAADGCSRGDSFMGVACVERCDGGQFCSSALACETGWCVP